MSKVETEAETVTINPEDVGKLDSELGFDSLVSTGGALVPTTGQAMTPSNDEGPKEMSTQSRVWTATPKLTSDDLTYPKLRLGQGTTAEVQNESAKAGDFILTGYDPVVSVTLVPLMMARAREYRQKDDVRQILCQSIDAETGVGIPGGICSACPKNEWTGPKGSRRPPDCSLIYSYVCYSVTHSTIAVMEFKKTGMPQAKFINTLVDNRGMGAFAINIGSQRKTNAKQQMYFEPVVTMAKVDDETFARARSSVV